MEEYTGIDAQHDIEFYHEALTLEEVEELHQNHLIYEFKEFKPNESS